MKKLLSLFIIVIITICGYPQNQQVIDSLLSVLKAAKPDTAKVNTLNELVYEFRNVNPDTAIYFAIQSQELASKLNYKIGIANGLIYGSLAEKTLGNYEKALRNINEALKIYEQILSSEKTAAKGKILKKKAAAYNNIGNIYISQGNSSEALKNHFAALEIRKEINDRSDIAMSYNNIGNIYQEQGNNPEALKNHFTSLKIREEIGDREGIADSHNNIGIIYQNQGNYPEALKSHSAALKIREEIKNKNGIGMSLINIGVVYSRLSNYPEALKNYLSALKIKEEIGDKRGIASSYANIGITYYKLDNYPEALKNYLSALKIKEEIGDKGGMARIYNSIGSIYLDQNNYPEALRNYFAALKIFDKIGDKQGIAGSYACFGIIYQNQGNYPEALKNDLAALKIYEELGDKQGIMLSYTNIGTVYMKQKKNNEASQYLKKGLLLAKEIVSIDAISQTYLGLSELDSAQGNFKQALEHYKLYIITRDSIYNKENAKKLVQQQMQYDFDKKEALTKAEQEKKDAVALKELQKQKLVRNSFVGGFAVVLLFAGVFFTQRNKIKTGKKRSDELLLNILPEEVAEELKAKGSADAKLIDDVTVLFTDFKGFTRLAEKLSPKELVSEINECFSAFDYIMQMYGVEKIKTIGDSYMAAGGLPSPNTTHAVDVVKAALDIQQYMQDHKARKEAVGELFFEIRIGVHTGPVVAGIVGIKKFAYDIWGDTVNTASRMESSGEVDKVNISGTTYELVKDQYTCIYRGKIQAKGKGEIDMYFVEGKQ